MGDLLKNAMMMVVGVVTAVSGMVVIAFGVGVVLTVVAALFAVLTVVGSVAPLVNGECFKTSNFKRKKNA